MITSIVAKRSLIELAKLRSILDASANPEDVLDPKAVEALTKEKGTDGGKRRLVSIALVDRLGSYLAKVLDTASSSEQEVFMLSGGQELVEGTAGKVPEVEDKKPFGFAHYNSENKG